MLAVDNGQVTMVINIVKVDSLTIVNVEVDSVIHEQ